MTIEKHPPEGYPEEIAAGNIVKGPIHKVPYIAISREVGFALRDETAGAGVPDTIVPVGGVVEFDTGIRLVSTTVGESAASITPYDQTK